MLNTKRLETLVALSNSPVESIKEQAKKDLDEMSLEMATEILALRTQKKVLFEEFEKFVSRHSQSVENPILFYIGADTLGEAKAFLLSGESSINRWIMGRGKKCGVYYVCPVCGQRHHVSVPPVSCVHCATPLYKPK